MIILDLHHPAVVIRVQPEVTPARLGTRAPPVQPLLGRPVPVQIAPLEHQLLAGKHGRRRRRRWFGGRMVVAVLAQVNVTGQAHRQRGLALEPAHQGAPIPGDSPSNRAAFVVVEAVVPEAGPATVDQGEGRIHGLI